MTTPASSPFVTRTFSVVESASTSRHEARPQPLSAFFTESALVVLGEPGAGKTTAFRDTAAMEAEATFVPIRDFLALSPDRWVGRTLYLDGLDELRVKTVDGASVLDQLRARLDGLGRPRFRLSCRAADWYGSSDVARLRLVAPDGRVTVLRIDPLTDADIVTIASALMSDPEAFVAEAATRGVHELLRNPLTLQMLLQVVQDGPWPDTRTDLYARATEVLVRERNEEHLRFQGATVTFDAVMRAAQTLCAVILCGGAKGIALTGVAATPDFPFVLDFPASLSALAAAARSRLLVSDGAERAVPVHRTLAEYLAARDLTERIREGLPFGRVLAVLTGYDSRPVADLRGVFAWVACLASEHARALIHCDPLGVVLYGDAGILAPSDRGFLLSCLGQLSTQDPWFRAGNWKAPALGGLATPEMADQFKAILENAAAPLSLVASILEALRYGRPLAQLKEPLLFLVKDAARDSSLRVEALHALQHASPEDVPLFVSLLNDIHEGRVADDDRRLRGILLSSLYPKQVSPQQVARYLIAPHPHFVSAYTMFVEYELLRLTPSGTIPALLDAVAKCQPLRRRDDFSRFIGELLVRGLTEHGTAVAAPKLWTWLGIAQGEHQEPRIDKKHQDAIRDWFGASPTRFRELYIHWLGRTSPTELWREQWTFWRRLHGAKSGPGHGRWLLDTAAAELDEVRADFLFREAVRSLIGGNDADAPTIDELFAYTEKHPRFADALQAELCWSIPDWRREEAERRQERHRQESEARARNADQLATIIDAIAAGTNVGSLSHLAQVFFGLFVNVDRKKGPIERLAAFAGQEYVAPILRGFVAILHRPDLPLPQMIGRLQTQSKMYRIGYAVLAGCDLVAADSMDTFSGLPPSTLKSALAFHRVNLTEQSRPWVPWLERERPELAAEALREFWAPQLERDAADIPGLYELAEPEEAEVARRVVLPLLRRFVTCREPTLRLLLAAAIRHSDREVLAALCARALRQRGLRGPARLVWLATAFALAPAELGRKVAKFLSGKREQARSFVGFLFSKERGAGQLLVDLGVPQRTLVIRLLGPMFPPCELSSGFQRVESDWEISQVVRSLIDGLSTDVTPAAGEALGALHSDGALSAWQDALAHGIRVQQADRREADFRYPGIEAVIRTLRGGPPANAADLQALLASELRALAEDIRHGVTDGYKALWNVDRHGRPTLPRPEDDCRDRLLDRLRPRLLKNQVVLEPEGQYADEKRADIKAIASALNIPVEIKRHYHRDLWSAPQRQLRWLYARDPGTEGRGIFLVLWFGADVAAPAKPPAGVPQPSTAVELLQALANLIPPEEKALTELVLIDCSRPLARQV